MLILSGFARFCKLNTKVGLLFCQSFRGPTFEICRRDEIGTRSRLKILCVFLRTVSVDADSKRLRKVLKTEYKSWSAVLSVVLRSNF